MTDLGIDLAGAFAGQADQLRSEGQKVMFVAVDGAAAGLVKETAPEALGASLTVELVVVLLLWVPGVGGSVKTP